MSRKNGFTLVELMLGLALIGIIFFLSSPLLKWYGRSEIKLTENSRVDERLQRIDEFIRGKIELVRKEGDEWSESLGVFSEVSSGMSIGDSDKKGSVLYIEVKEYESVTTSIAILSFEDSKLMYQKNTGDDAEVLLEDVEKAEFRYYDTEKILAYFIKIKKVDTGEGGTVKMGGVAILE